MEDQVLVVTMEQREIVETEETLVPLDHPEMMASLYVKLLPQLVRPLVVVTI